MSNHLDLDGGSVIAESLSPKQPGDYPDSLMRQNSSNMTDSSKTDRNGQNSESSFNSSSFYFEDELQKKDTRISQLQTELDETKTRLVAKSDEEEQYSALYAANDDLKSNVFEAAEESSDNHSSSWPTSVGRESEDMTDIKRKLEDKDRKLREKEEELRREREEKECLSRRLKEAMAKKVTPSVRSRNALDENILFKLNQTMGKCKEQEEMLNDAHRAVENYKKQCDVMSKRLSEMGRDTEAKSDEQVQQYEKDREDFQQELQALRDSLDGKSHALEVEASKCKMVEESLRNQQGEWQEQKQQLQKQQGDLEKEKQLLRSDSDKKTMQLQVLEESLHVEKEQRTQYYSQVRVLLGEKEKIQADAQNLEEEKGRVEKQAKDLCTGFQEQAKEAWLSFDQLKAKSEQDSQDLMELRGKLKKFMTRIENLRTENDELKSASAILTEEKQQLQATLTTNEDAIVAIKITAEDYESDFKKESEARNDLARRMKRERAENDAVMQKYKKEIDSLTSKLDTVLARNENISKDNKDLMEQLNNMAATQCHAYTEEQMN